ncbi:hypothetical protein U6N30_25785 [Blastococcus brunescens]|uniref:Porphobilinogen deaminase N-terminal domain-containing protein n=1 Tax=Blastococcus brunescens TaxID=1564165 RepID=A0ABZ1AZ26_9ACTN|nr:hypothetical protein [Blastococcus sp. BMG 8361]WRL63171.1 hypothetical protein U6N30_25785 [Blastococcus sp. BMG 8361]
MTTSTATTTLRLGTRGSELATTQSQTVADAITAATGVRVELVPIVTEGDRSRAAIQQLGARASSWPRCGTRCWPARWISPCTATRTCRRRPSRG